MLFNLHHWPKCQHKCFFPLALLSLTGTVPTQTKQSSPFQVGHHTEQDLKKEDLPNPPPFETVAWISLHNNLITLAQIFPYLQTMSTDQPPTWSLHIVGMSLDIPPLQMITRTQSSEACSLFVILRGIFFIFYKNKPNKSSPLCSRSDLDNCQGLPHLKTEILSRTWSNQWHPKLFQFSLALPRVPLLYVA